MQNGVRLTEVVVFPESTGSDKSTIMCVTEGLFGAPFFVFRPGPRAHLGRFRLCETALKQTARCGRRVRNGFRSETGNIDVSLIAAQAVPADALSEKLRQCTLYLHSLLNLVFANDNINFTEKCFS